MFGRSSSGKVRAPEALNRTSPDYPGAGEVLSRCAHLIDMLGNAVKSTPPCESSVKFLNLFGTREHPDHTLSSAKSKEELKR